jgi:glycosyltransferase involved in cell wall biosynthesis
MSDPFISFLVTCHNEGKQLRRLLNLLTKYNDGNEIVILDDYSDDKDTADVLHEYQSVVGVKLVAHHLDKNYGEHKNYGNSYCKGKYIFQIDADELPNEVLLDNLKSILESNSATEMFWVSRANNFVGITPLDIKTWGWRVNERNHVNWPDYQSRIYKNLSHIKWERKLHETIIGMKSFAKLPAQEELSLYHEKTIEKQRSDNQRYTKDFNVDDNIRKK